MIRARALLLLVLGPGGLFSGLVACGGAPGPAPIDFRGASTPPSAGIAAPAASASAPDRAAGATEGSIVVPPGATLFQISEAERVSLRALIDANDLEPPFRLSAGQTLTLPPRNTYVVQPGDTFFAIARRHRVQLRSLGLLNGLREPYAIAPGDVIELPGSARDWEAAARPITDGPRTLDTASAAGPAPQFVWPADGPVLDGFGPKAGGRRNDGLNIAAAEGDPVRAAADGQVVYAGDDLAGYGQLVLVRHAEGWISAYAHNRRLLVAEGQGVRQGQRIAEAGSTGGVETSQLHFEVRRAGRPLDPASVLPQRRG